MDFKNKTKKEILAFITANGGSASLNAKKATLIAYASELLENKQQEKLAADKKELESLKLEQARSDFIRICKIICLGAFALFVLQLTLHLV